jgi:VIT1/CCC1 family predicted Fe2+/Mn2+ transporter
MKEKYKKAKDKLYFINCISWLRPAVLGANDGIITIASMMVGMIAGNASLEVIPLSGIVVLVSGATAMATGEYVSVSSQSDATAASFAIKQKESMQNSDAGHKKLAQIYISRGLKPSLAHEVAARLIECDALNAHANKALGIEMTFIKPLQAALVSAASFIAGGTIPLLVVIASPNKFLLFSVIISSLFTLALLGTLSAKIGKVKILKPTIRILILGVISLSISTIVGLLFNLNL